MCDRHGWGIGVVSVVLFNLAICIEAAYVAAADECIHSDRSNIGGELFLAMQPPPDTAAPVADDPPTVPPRAKPVPQPEEQPAESPKAKPAPAPQELPAELPRVERAPEPPRTTIAQYRISRLRLASVPNMLGDTLPPEGQVFAFRANILSAQSDIPLAGGARRSKVSENNKALPMDRVFCTYSHFENARDIYFDSGGPPPEFVDSWSIDRYVFGFEKTLFDEMWSVDVRMPFVSRFDVSLTANARTFAVSGGEIGNLHLIAKRLLYITDCGAAAGGLGIDVPTGSDARGEALQRTFRVSNDAVHLMPFIGVLRAPDDHWFYHGFLELDVPLNGNGLAVEGVAAGRITEQTLLNLDVSAGRLLYRCPDACLLTGIAATVEFHYTTTLRDSDVIELAPLPPLDTYTFGNLHDQLDIVNLTTGLHAELNGNTTLRVGAMFPLTDESNRLFDAEVQVQFNRYF